MSHWRSQLNNYHGSKMLMPIASSLGIQVDKLNFLAAGFTTVGFAYLYCLLMNLGQLSARSAKLLLSGFGMVVLFFCFGRDLIFVVVEAAVGFVLMRVCPLEKLPRITMIFSLTYQSMLHLYRQFADPGGYTIDVTGGLMMLTQRVTSVAFSVRDGIEDRPNLTPAQENEAIKERPDALTYFAYMFDFHMLLAGPLVPFNVFERVANGGNLRADGSSPVKHCRIVEQLLCVTVSILMLLNLAPLITEGSLLSEWYAEQTLLFKIVYLLAFTFVCRLQYYIAWKLAEATCQASGYGYWVDKDGIEHYDGADNINILSVEFATSFKNLIDNWNISTQRWLKHVCYDRDIDFKTARTFLLSALWHGLYPGYFMAFLTNMYFVLASRQVRHHLRPVILMSGCPKFVYDIVTWMFTMTFLAYSVIPFIMLHSNKAFYMWKQLYFFGHILATASFFLPAFFPGRSSVAEDSRRRANRARPPSQLSGLSES